MKAYAYGGVDAFENFLTNTLLIESYVSGVSLTVGLSPPVHVWTFAAGRSETARTSQPGQEIPDQCPCDRSDPSDILVPSFLGNNYFCESGLNGPTDFTRTSSDILSGLQSSVDVI